MKIRKILSESYDDLISKFKSIGDLASLKTAIQSNSRFKFMGSGQYGFAMHDTKTNVVFKFSNSKAEFDKAIKFKGKNLKTIVKIFDCVDLGFVFLIIREYVTELLDSDLSEKIADESDNLYEFMTYTNGELDKYSNLYQYWKNEPELFNFFKQLRTESRSCGVNPKNLDVIEGGIADNIGYVNGSMKLFDF